MTPRLKISITDDVLSRLAKVEKPAVGSLFGHFFNNTLLLVGFSVQNVTADQEEENRSFCKIQPDLLHKLPTEVDFCGVITFGSKLDDSEMDECFTEIIQDVDITDNPVLLSYEDKDNVSAYLYINQKFEKTPYEVVTQTQISASFVNVRMRAEIPMSCECTRNAVQEAFEGLRKKVVAGLIAFQLQHANVLLSGSDSEGGSGVVGVTPDHMVKDLLDSPGSSKKDKTAMEFLFVNMLLKQTLDSFNTDTSALAPVIHHKKRSFSCIKFPLVIDGISLVNRNTKVSDLYNILVNSFCRNIRLLESCLLTQLEKGFNSVSVPEPFHFLPPSFSHFITTAYPKCASDTDLRQDRATLHKIFALPLDRPLFRRSLAYKFPGDQQVNGPLLNPHEGLNSGVKGGEPSLVQGLYHYHHYMQDRFDDNGWGCAYRSLQTIVSWFRLQGYTEVEVPTHKQIQECLVKIGDKPSSFIGSRQWIGSTEVSFVLETMLGVSCRILRAENGSEMAMFGSELSHHFKTHGTPVMIGGGVLAHTIIGVDYNRSSDELKFLILDPHYTGGEDRGVITSKGWVGWKDTKFWAKNAFYNMCLPLRPVGDI